ncbi:MAG: type II toxin-antitoxin system Phd/YefM family antitoxin [Alphaproteobacteria bacterium]|nr:type II toxin-antitoxin system Phd/YefM family antitoxin [Alphaproteobacteria bacterium]
MDNGWAVQDAKARFAEFLREVDAAPQIITYRGKPKYEVRLIENDGAKKAQPKTLYEIWKSAPKVPGFKLPPRRREKPRKIF